MPNSRPKKHNSIVYFSRHSLLCKRYIFNDVEQIKHSAKGKKKQIQLFPILENSHTGHLMFWIHIIVVLNIITTKAFVIWPEYAVVVIEW